MIFVSVGTHKNGFDRLIKEIDLLIEKKIITEKVFAQIGNGKYTPKNFKYTKFLTEKKMEKQVKNCSTYITHGGVSLGTGLEYKKTVIVVPRLKKFNEIIDNHQIDVAIELEKNKKIIYCKTEKELKEKIKEKIKFPNKKEKIIIINILNDFIKNNFN